MSDHLVGTIWTLWGRPCRIRTFAVSVWVDFLDGQEPAIGNCTRHKFGRSGHPVRGQQATYLASLAELLIDRRVPFEIAQREAMKGVAGV